MKTHVLVHFLNIAPGREGDYGAYFERSLADIGAPLTGAQRFRVADAQLGKIGADQPYKGLALYDLAFDPSPDALQVLAEVVRDAPLRDGLLSDERAHLFEILRHRAPSPTPRDLDRPAHVCLVMANYVPTMRAEWSDWYDRVHEPEILGVEGVNAMGRGILAPAQIPPANLQPANGIVIHYNNTDDLAALFTDFAARNSHTSPSGVKWSKERSPAATMERTTHAFTAVTHILTAPGARSGHRLEPNPF